MSDIKWPDWREVAKGGKHELGRMVAWPVPTRNEPQLIDHQRNQPRRLIRVEANSLRSSVAGYLCEKGVNYLLVYENEIESIRRHVATDRDRADMKAATEEYEAELAEFQKSVTARPGENLTQRQAAEASIGCSPQTMFYKRAGRTGRRTGYPKLERMDVHPDPVPAPETPESVADMQSEKLAAAMGRAMATQLPAALAQLGNGKQRAAG